MGRVRGRQRSLCRLRRMLDAEGLATLADMDEYSEVDADPRGKWSVVYQLAHRAVLSDPALGSGSPSLVCDNLFGCPRSASSVDVFGGLRHWPGSGAGTCFSHLDRRLGSARGSRRGASWNDWRRCDVSTPCVNHVRRAPDAGDTAGRSVLARAERMSPTRWGSGLR